VAANIRVGRPQARQEEVERAARLANALEFIQRMPQGFATPVGERGQRLSAGQRQRLALARAVLKDPEILILDEATSNLDPESEELILEALSGILEGKTALIISHRPQTLRWAGRIAVLEHGRLAEDTTPQALLQGGEGRLANLMGLER
jgi:ABC-type multidrug transport system fused ATPase/permease subunit